MTSTTRVMAALAAAAVLIGAHLLHAQAKRPDFSGTWQIDIEASKALTEKMGHQWRVAGAGMGGGSATAPANIMRPFTDITQSEAEIVFQTRYDTEIIRREVHKLDGSTSVNARSNISTRSTTVWKGEALVTTGTTHLDYSDGSARRADGTPITEITRQFVTTRRVMPDGTMHIETRTTEEGNVRYQYSVLVRVKSS